MERKLHQAETNYQMKLRNLKPIVFKEAADFIKEEAVQIMDQLSKQHRTIVKNYLDYRAFAEGMIAQRDYMHR